MRKLLFFLFAALVFAACTQHEFDDNSANFAGIQHNKLTVGFENDDTRIQLNSAYKSVWNKGDEVSVFYKNYSNLKWRYLGEDGERSGLLEMVDGVIDEATMEHIVVAYPYDTSYKILDESATMEATLPATQSFLSGSYGHGGNIMVAAGESESFTLKNICSWLRIDLSGDGQKVSSMTFRGNNNEQVAGLFLVDAYNADIMLAAEMVSNGYQLSIDGNLSLEDVVETTVTLDCGDGIELDSTATSFYIGLLPQTFYNGASVMIKCTDGTIMSIGTTEVLDMERNHIQPINAGSYEGYASELCEIVYTSEYTPLSMSIKDGFGANLIDNVYDAETSCGVLKFDAPVTAIPNNAFNGNRTLRSITIPDSVMTIGNYSFINNWELSCITIGKGVTSIGECSFYGCDNLTAIFCMATTPPTGGVNMFNTQGNENLGIYVPAESLQQYKETEEWSVYADMINAYNFDTTSTLTYSATDNKVVLANLPIISNSYDSNRGEIIFYGDGSIIPHGAFINCPNLISLTIDTTTVPTLGDNVFLMNSNFAVSVPQNLLDNYKSDESWRAFKYQLFPIAYRSNYHIGDIVTHNGAQGMVYFVSDAVVRLVSMDWNNSVEWGSYELCIGANNEYVGLENIDLANASGYHHILKPYIWAESLGDGWYLPAIQELCAIYDVKDALAEHGHTGMDRWYWSSTEGGGTTAMVRSFSQGTIHGSYKYSLHDVVGITAF